jgi:hypothetical protein
MSSFNEFLGGTIGFSKTSAVYFAGKIKYTVSNKMGNEAPDSELLDCQP